MKSKTILYFIDTTLYVIKMLGTGVFFDSDIQDICSWPILYYQYRWNISSIFSSNSGELLENLE